MLTFSFFLNHCSYKKRWEIPLISHIFCFKGHESQTYYRVRVKFRGDSFLIGAHQLAHWVHTNFELKHDGTKEISHLCHLPNCTNPMHLTYETRTVNNDRRICKNLKKCIGHGEDHSDCIL